MLICKSCIYNKSAFLLNLFPAKFFTPWYSNINPGPSFFNHEFASSELCIKAFFLESLVEMNQLHNARVTYKTVNNLRNFKASL